MKDISNENFVTVKRDDRRSAPLHRSKRLVAHACPQIGNSFVGDECGVVGNHVIGIAGICHHESSRGWTDGGDSCSVG